MTPVIPCSVSHVMLIPETTFLSRKNNHITRCNLLRSSSGHQYASPRFLLPLSPSTIIFPKYGKWSSIHSRSSSLVSAATETEVTIEESASTVASEDAEGNQEIPSDAVEESEVPSSTASSGATLTARSKRSRSVRKSEMPPVKNEELIPGATFTGKVRSIQPFGAFVDFGAFTDGLVHVSQLSDSFVKDVGSVVSIGQEVKVKLLEANTENGRISLTMREGDGSSKVQQQQKESPARSSGDKRRNTTRSNQKRSEAQKSSKFVKGQVLDGTVKNMNRAGAFISLPEGEEGFLPTSEESDDELGNIMGGTSLQVGQEVSVRVLRITRGQVTLTMKSENIEDSGSSVVQGVVHTATNPFVLAFRKNKDIASFLDKREDVQKPTDASVVKKDSEEVEEKVEQREILSGGNGEVLADDPNSSEIKEEVKPADTIIGTTTNELQNEDESAENTISSSSQTPEIGGENAQEEKNLSENSVLKSEVSEPNEMPSPAQNDEKLEPVPTENMVNEEVADDVVVKDEVEPPAASSEDEKVEPVPTENMVNEEVTDDVVVKDELIPPAVSSEDEKVEPVPTENMINVEVADDVVVKDEVVPPAVSSEDEKVEPVPLQSSTSEEIVEGGTNNVNVKYEVPEQTNEIPSVGQNEEENVESVPEKNSAITNSSKGPDVPTSQNTETEASISPALVKQLREETGAGMMDCKKALSETGGDIIKAQEFLRKKGLASADKKASRATAEGRIGSYIHDSRIGVLIEVNCETDFVSRGDIFKELVDDLAMQVAACPQVKYLNIDDVPEDIVNKEREIEMQKEDLLSKPEQIRAKIVDGRIRKRLEELALLEQPYIKNDKVAVKDWVKQTIATIGENIKVKRFERYNLGEGLEKKSQDFAAEVAAQTAAKSSPPPPPMDQPVAFEAKETIDKAPTVTISAALVKQLREETGAGMMDCKKALAESGGNIEKAQEYLRKKGLSTADKKSTRLAAEGRIGSYIHDSRIGVLIEVNCETDFVGRGEKFKELVDDLAMQVVACPQVLYASIEEIPESIVSKEKELEMQREDLLSKPENIRERIVEGRVSKRLGELALLEQPFIKNDGILVKDLVKQTVAALGENIKVRRFVRFTLGETVEKA